MTSLTPRQRLLALTVLWLIAVVALVGSRNYLLDDALIHLRFAENLTSFGRFEFNPGEHSFGSSSMGWLGIVALWNEIYPGPWGLKSLAVAVYIGLVAIQSTRWWVTRSLPDFLLLGAICSPMGVRWLADGMETALTAAMAFGLVWMCEKFARSAWLGVVAFVAVMVRVELAAVVVVCAALLVRKRSFVGAASLIAGVVGSIGVVLAALGHLISDAAVAKSTGLVTDVLGWIRVVSISHLAAMSLGMGLLAALALSVAQAWKRGARELALCAVLPIAALLGAAFLRGQEIQGIRYFVWALGVGVYFATESDESAKPTSGTALSPYVPWSILALFGVAAVVEWRFVHRIFSGRGDALVSMNGAHLNRLANTQGVAWDVGFVGYFTEGQVCDPNGLVNGRAVAQMPRAARSERCLNHQPDWAFASEGQYQALQAATPETAWRTCPSLIWQFPNVNGRDIHILVLPLEAALDWCGARALDPDAAFAP